MKIFISIYLLYHLFAKLYMIKNNSEVLKSFFASSSEAGLRAAVVSVVVEIIAVLICLIFLKFI